MAPVPKQSSLVLILTFSFARRSCSFCVHLKKRENRIFGIHIFSHSSQRAHDVNITSPQRRCNVMTLHRRWGDVIFTSCARWVIFMFTYVQYSCLRATDLLVMCGNPLTQDVTSFPNIFLPAAAAFHDMAFLTAHDIFSWILKLFPHLNFIYFPSFR